MSDLVRPRAVVKMAGVNIDWSDYSNEEDMFTHEQSAPRAWQHSRLFESSSRVDEESFFIEQEDATPSSSSYSHKDLTVDDLSDPLDAIAAGDSDISSLSDQLQFILKDLGDLPPPEWNFTPTECPIY